jgi:hypothetical protein
VKIRKENLKIDINKKGRKNKTGNMNNSKGLEHEGNARKKNRSVNKNMKRESCLRK